MNLEYEEQNALNLVQNQPLRNTQISHSYHVLILIMSAKEEMS